MWRQGGEVFKLVKGTDEQAADRIRLGFVKPVFWAVVWVMSSGFVASHAWLWLNAEVRTGQYADEVDGFSGLMFLEKARPGVRDPHPPIRIDANRGNLRGYSGSYSFRMTAHKNSRLVGQLLVHLDRALSWRYAFAVLE